MCYKHTFYGIDSHRCVQMTPTLKCNQRCLFCWRSFEHEVKEEEEISPEEIFENIPKLQKKALSGYKVSKYVTSDRFNEALSPTMTAISLSGEPTLYSKLPELIDLLNGGGYTTFLVSNGTMPEVLERCHPYQTYVSLDAPDIDTYTKICRPFGEPEKFWNRISKSIMLLSERRSAIRITVVNGINDHSPEKYAEMIKRSGTNFVEVKGYMYLGYSRKRLERSHMPEHDHIREFADKIAEFSGYELMGESPLSRVVCLERNNEI